jgi:Flp pilus assembly protein TadG
MLQSIRRYARDDRGIALVLVAASMVVVLSFAALAIDVGKLTVARSEAQRTADLAALAGAGSLLLAPGNTASAIATAEEYALKNTVRGENVQAALLDVQVDLALQTVRVQVNRTRARNSPVTTAFARIFGVNEVDITADATAQVLDAGGANCLLPIVMPDKWTEVGGDPDDFEESLGDIYIPYPDAGYTGYQESDRGKPIRIKEGKGPGTMNPSWSFPWRPPGQSGGADYRENIHSCVDPTLEYFVGMEINAEPGNMVGPTKQGFKILIDKDRDAIWNTNENCVTSFGSSVCRGSDRIRAMPMFSPAEEPGNGMKPFTITNFVAVFIEEVQGNDVYARIVTFSGIDTGGGGGAGNPLFKTVKLIE